MAKISYVWDENKNGKEKLTEKKRGKDSKEYWWLCEKNHSFKATKSAVVCPLCSIKESVEEINEECPYLFENFVLTPYEEYICSLLKDLDLSTYDGEKYNDIRILKKNKIIKMDHFGLHFSNGDFKKISPETYIDNSIYDDIICRRSRFEIDNKMTPKSYYYIYSKLIEDIIRLEGVDSEVDLSELFIYELFLQSIANFYPRCLFNQDELYAEYDQAVDELKRRIDGMQKMLKHKYDSMLEISILIDEYKLSKYGDKASWEKRANIYNSYKEKLLEAKSINDTLKILNDMCDEYTLTSVLGYKKHYAENGADLYLGNYPKKQIELAICRAEDNYERNMIAFNHTSDSDFNDYLNNYVIHNEFSEIDNLKTMQECTGLYIMVLGKYKRVYIGQAIDIKKRILQHWKKTANKPIGRLVLRDADRSVLSINSFGPYDTTRIFVKLMTRERLDEEERNMIEKFDSKYTLNRITGGGISNGYDIIER